MKNILLVLFIGVNFNVGLFSQETIEYKDIKIYPSSHKLDNTLLRWAYETIDSLTYFQNWKDSLYPEIDFFEFTKYVDRVFRNTELSNFSNLCIPLTCKSYSNWICHTTIIVVRCSSKKNALSNKNKIYKYYKHDWFDIATPHMVCTTKGNYLRLILFSGDPPDLSQEMLNYFKVTNNKN